MDAPGTGSGAGERHRHDRGGAHPAKGQPATARIFFKNPVLEGNAEDTIYWRKSEIKKGDHIVAYEKHRDSLKKQLKE